MKFLLLFVVFVASFVNASPLKDIEHYVTGTFSNFKQVYGEILAGNQVHPLGVEKSANANSKIVNLPLDFDGVFVIHEAFYFPPSGPMVSKPNLFLFEESDGSVKISSYVSPVPPSDLRNDNFGKLIS
jgi:hypothetical protein